MSEIQELLIRNLLFAIVRSKNGVISAEEAAVVVGEENVEPLRTLMDERKWLMGRHSRIENGFQLTAKGLGEAMPLFVAEVQAEGGEATVDSVMELLNRLKEPLGPPEVWTKEQPLKVYADGGKARAFLLPDTRGLLAELLACIPLKWQRVWGELRAPVDLVTSGEASAHGGYYLGMSRHHWASDQDERSRDLPGEEFSSMMAKVRFDILDIIERHKLPGFIKFDEAGSFGQSHELPFRSLLATIITYIGRGYGGHIRLYRDDITEDRSRETVEFRFDEWVENSFGIRIARPAVVQVAWHDREQVAELLDLCAERGLERVPTRIK